LKKNKDMLKDFPRRARNYMLTPAEKAIYTAMQEVELMEADERLTDAIELLDKARNKVADYVDEQLNIKK
jgi:ribosome assembly protein YihI (activator of Der GTPase)